MDVCARCLGRRIVGAVGPAQIEAARDAQVPVVQEEECRICEGMFVDLATWQRLALEAAGGHEARTVQVGTLFPKECEEREAAFAAAWNEEHGTPFTDSVRTEANRALAAFLREAGFEPVTEGRPDLAVVVDTRFWTTEVRPSSVFVRGRYTKHRRDLPQTHWPCKTCQGLGCFRCDDTGVMYASSVEDVIAAELVPAFGASGASFHGGGREDIDALMLGKGRPFVMELHGPRRRSLDLAPLEQAIGAASQESGVGVLGLAMAAKEDVVAVKEAAADKEYLAHCEASSPVPAAALAGLTTLAGTVLEQRTPERVSHRRADLVRRRTIHALTVESHAGAAFTLRVNAESGTYIKEFVSGDDGRTTPSVAALLGMPVKVAALDVVGIDA